MPETTDAPSVLARELREMHAGIMAAANGEGRRLPIMFRFAMKDRIDRLCSALGVQDA